MFFGKENQVKLEVIGIDVKNFPVVSRLPFAPNISTNTLDVLRGRLQRHRDEFRSMYNEQHRRQQIPLSLRTDAEVDAAAIALQDTIPVTTEYMRLNETLKNLEQISQGARRAPVVYWMGVKATFDGSNGSGVLTTSVKEGTNRFSWFASDLRSNMSLSVVRCFPHLFHRHTSVEQRTPLRFFLNHHWKPTDEKTISSGEDIVCTLAYAELPLEKISFGERPKTISRDLPLMVAGSKLPVLNNGRSSQMNVEVSISFIE